MRVMIVLVGSIILFAAFVTPWWTRGFSFEKTEGGDFETATPRDFTPGLDQPGFSYMPFQTPGAGTVTTDASRAAAVAVLGIGFLISALFASASVTSRLLMKTGRLEHNPGIAATFAMVSFVAGVFTIVWAAFFLPLLGNNPGWLYGSELPTAVANSMPPGWAETRYANAGFFLGILGTIAYPAYLWADANRARNELTTGAPVSKSAGVAY